MIFHGDGHGIRQIRQPTATDFIIRVDNRLPTMVRREKQPFRGFVMLHVAVIIQMVTA